MYGGDSTFLSNYFDQLFAFVVLGLVSSILSKETGWEERISIDLFCVERDIGLQPELSQRNVLAELYVKQIDIVMTLYRARPDFYPARPLFKCFRFLCCTYVSLDENPI